MRYRFLVVYDYGQGGLWGYVLAGSPEEITQRCPELRVIEDRPAWLDEEHEARLRACEEDIDEPGRGLLGILLAGQRPRVSPEPSDDSAGCVGHSGVVPIPKIVAAGATVIRWEGLALGLLSVESWPERTEIRIVGVAESDEAKQREALHRQALSAWLKEVERAHREGLPIPHGPEHPLGDHAERLRVSLTDDAGTAYRWKSSGSQGGRSWEFVAESRFVPAPPADARELTVTFDVQDGPSASTTVALY